MIDYTESNRREKPPLRRTGVLGVLGAGYQAACTSQAMIWAQLP